jgi:hypothetical protein
VTSAEPDVGRARAVAPVDLKHVALIVSAAAAVALRFLSDFSFATIEHQAAQAGVDLSRISLGTLASLFVTMLRYELQRDWFNLSPQAPPELLAVVVLAVAMYVALRLAVAPAPAAASVLLAMPFLPLLATFGGCGWVLLRAARQA